MDQLQKTDEEGRRNGINTNVTFALTVLPCEPALLRRARRLVGGEADARDLVQETLERALRTFHAFRPGTAVWAWLRTIMNSVWIDCWRRRQVAQRITAYPLVDVAQPEQEPTPHDRIDTILERLPRTINRLPPIFRQVLELRMLSSWSYEAIAHHLGIPVRTVGTRILRARRQLRELIEHDLATAAEHGDRAETTEAVTAGAEPEAVPLPVPVRGRRRGQSPRQGQVAS
jgi:RNA polymerase sigma-70 factor (ECF subfamily)